MPRSARRRLLRRHLLAIGLVGGLVLGGPPAVADDDDVERRGRCSQGAEWKVKASPEDGRIEVEGEVEGGAMSGRWRWRLFHNDSLSARGTRSYGSDGSMEVRRVMTDLAGTDTFSFRARNRRSGEWCRAPISF